MTVKELFNFIKGVRPGFAFTDAQLTVWLNEIEGHVQTDIWLLEPAVDETQTGLVEYDSTIDPETSEMVDANHELLVPFPWNKLYRYFLLMSIDLANGEYQRYANSYELFNEAYEEYAGWYAQHVSPANGQAITRGYYITAYQFAARGGYAGTEKEFTELLGTLGLPIDVSDLSTEVQRRLASSTFYNVQNYGIKPNTGEDLYYILFDFLHNVVCTTGGIVYFPVGQYLIGNTILIPPNTIFLGEGRGTEIKFTERKTNIGVGLGNGGDNVGIVNMTVNCSNYNKPVPGPMTGAVAFGNTDFYSQTRYDMYAYEYTQRTTKNLFAEKLWSDTRYILQTETGDNGYTVTNVVYKDIQAEKGVVSIMARSTGDVTGAKIENVTCAFLRVGSAATTGYITAVCNDIRTGRLWAKTNQDTEHRIDITNIKILPSLKWDDFDDATGTSYGYESLKGAVTLQGNISITNGDFDCAAYRYGITRYRGKVTLTNVVVKNYTKKGWPGVISATTPTATDNTFINCIFDDSHAEPGASAISGVSISSKINSSGRLLDGRPVASNIASGAEMDLNNYTEQGEYCCHASSVIDDIINGPIANKPFYLRVIRLDYLYAVRQIFADVSNAKYIYIRHGVYHSDTDSFTFGPWFAFEGSAIT